MSARLDFDAREVKRALDRLAREGAPRAIADALNRTAFEIREQLGRESSASFDFVSPGTKKFLGSERAFVFDKAKPGHLAVTIRPRSRAAELLTKQVRGATLRADGRFAVPINVRRTARGVPRRKRPRVLLGEGGRGFIPEGSDVIVERRRKRGRGVVAYALVPQVRIPPRFDFFGAVRRAAVREFPRKVQRVLEKRRAGGG